MAHIVLTEEQARIIAESANGIEVRDSQGRLLGFLQRLFPDEVAIIEQVKQRRQTPGPMIPGARVLAMLKTLDAMQETEEVTREKVQEVLRKVKSGELL